NVLPTLHNSNTLHPFFLLIILLTPRSTLFPTRRSSDLWRSNAPVEPIHRRCDSTRQDELHCLCGLLGHLCRHLQVRLAHRPENRSEEHTSELQSRGHLVCRLLLEKKKINLLHVSRPIYS